MTATNILTRLRAATGPDRVIDAEIMFDLFAKPVGQKVDGGPVGYLWPQDNPSWSFGMRFPGKDRDWFTKVRRNPDGETLLIERDGALVLMNSLRVPPLTASIDAALALVDRMLPGWNFQLFNNHTKGGWMARLRSPSYKLHCTNVVGGEERRVSTAPIAILCALFGALAARDAREAE